MAVRKPAHTMNATDEVDAPLLNDPDQPAPEPEPRFHLWRAEDGQYHVRGRRDDGRPFTKYVSGRDPYRALDDLALYNSSPES